MSTFNRTAHMQLWKWLSENIECDKNEWPEWDYNGGQYIEVDSYCFACESCIIKSGKVGNIYVSECICPLAWPEIPKDQIIKNDYTTACMQSLYAKWLKLFRKNMEGRSQEEDRDELRKVCLEIMNLPANPEWKGEVE